MPRRRQPRTLRSLRRTTELPSDTHRSNRSHAHAHATAIRRNLPMSPPNHPPVEERDDASLPIPLTGPKATRTRGPRPSLIALDEPRPYALQWGESVRRTSKSRAPAPRFVGRSTIFSDRRRIVYPYRTQRKRANAAAVFSSERTGLDLRRPPTRDRSTPRPSRHHHPDRTPVTGPPLEGVECSDARLWLRLLTGGALTTPLGDLVE